MKRQKRLRAVGRANIIFYAVLSLTVLALVTVFLVFREDIDSRTLERFLDLFRLGKTRENAEELSFDAGLNNLFTLSGERFCVLSTARLALYNRSGEEIFSRSVGYESPAMTTAGDKLIAFDRMNPYGLVLNKGELAWEPDFRIMAASGNSRGQYVLAAEESGLRGAARFYNEKDEGTFQWNSSSYISAVGLSPSGTRMLSASAAQKGVSLVTEIIFLETENTEPLAKVELPETLALDAYYPDNSHVCILTESGVYFYSDDGKPLGEYRWDGELLLGFYPTEKALFLHVGPWTNKRYGRLICLGYEGTVNGEVSLSDAPDEIRAFGKVCAVLQSGSMTEYIYDGESFKERAHWETEAVSMLLADENTMLMLYHNKAVWK